MKRTVMTAAIAGLGIASMLVACGGGGGEGEGSGTTAASALYASYVGTYDTGCLTTDPGSPPPLNFPAKSQRVKVEVTSAVDKQADVRVTWSEWNSADCSTNNTLQGTGTFTISDAGATKTVPASGVAPGGSATVATVSLKSATLSNGSLLGGIPMLGATTQVGFRVEGSTLYVLKGERQSDGLPGAFSKYVATRQP